MKIIIAMDSYKGTFSSIEISDLIEQAIHKVDSRITTVKIPMSDGGDGFLNCFKGLSGITLEEVPSFNSMMHSLQSTYLIRNKKTAIIELATTAGLAQVENNNVLEATTYGVGIQIKDALSKGIRDFILGIGGSATNDAGVGILCALGCVFLDKENHPFVPTGGTLERIVDLDLSSLCLGALDSEFTIYSDVTNPLLGEFGASHVYALQKGANEKTILKLEKNMSHYSKFLFKKYGFNTDFEGAGAAGGCSVSLKCFLHAKTVRGIDELLKLLSFEKQIKDASVIITGEGKLDNQSFYGKVLEGILSKAKIYQIPVVSISGQVVGSFDRDLFQTISLYDPSKRPIKNFSETPMLLEQKTIEWIQSLKNEK